MPRKAKGPRLYLDQERGQWAIRDGKSFVRTGCAESDNENAEKKLAEYIASKYRPAPTPSPAIADVLLVYARERLPKTKAASKAAHNISNLTPFWGKLRAGDVNATNCEAYAKDRSPSAARRDLEVLRASLYYWHKNKEQLARQPQIVLPEKNDPRERWLTYEEAHRLRKASMKHLHLYRFVLLALKTGSRSEVLFNLKWSQVDLRSGILTRKAAGETEAANKRKPPVRLGKSMVRLMRRWKAKDGKVEYVVHYDGAPIQKLRRSFDKACEEAELENVSPHTLRHTRATWLMQEGVEPWEAAGHLGMSVRTLENVYAKHHPDFQSKSSEV